MLEYDIIIIGGGAAGMTAAIKAKEEGINNILVIEREDQLGGTLNQYIHLGFGIDSSIKTLTGPEYVQELINKLNEFNISYILNSLVIEINEDKKIIVVNENGIIEYKAKAIVLATGSREKPRGVINIANNRCAGIFTIGTAQRFINIEGYMPGKEVVIVGAGDSSLLMAKSLLLEGANVKAIIEPMPYASGTNENIVESAEDFNIPLQLSCTVVDIKGKDRVEGVVISRVDDNNVPINGTEEFVSCNTLLLSSRVLPESEFLRKAEIQVGSITRGVVVDKDQQTSLEGIFACGDIVYVHNLEEDITIESNISGKNAANYVLAKN